MIARQLPTEQTGEIPSGLAPRRAGACGRTAPRWVDLELRDVPWSDPLETLRIGSRLVSSKVGLIRSFSYGAFKAQDPVLHAVGVGQSELSRFSDIQGGAKAGGAGETIAAALAATIGEAVERYCMYVYDRREVVLAAWEEVPDDAVHPDQVRLYSRSQLENRRIFDRHELFTERSRVGWVWGYSLTERRPRLVPASMVYLDYRVDRNQGEAAIGRNASSGLAAGLTLEEAVLTGLLEVIERDSFVICWLQRHMGPRIRVDEPELQELLQRKFQAGSPRVTLQIFDNTLDTPAASTLAILRRPTECGPVLCVGSAARLDPRRAVLKCLYEAGQSVSFIRYLRKRDRGWEPAADFSNLDNFDLHALHYNVRPELIPEAFGFCDRVEEEVPLSALPNRSTGRVLGDLEYLIERLRELGSEVIVVDITTPEIREIGLRVVRVVATRLVPLHGNHNRPFLGPRRLYEVPEKLGWARRGWHPAAGLNPYPHPFP
jgi:ribosomal protein S12 methylthiotransferase accessory factor